MFESGPIRTQVCLRMERACKQTNNQACHCYAWFEFANECNVYTVIFGRLIFSVQLCVQHMYGVQFHIFLVFKSQYLPTGAPTPLKKERKGKKEQQ